MISLKDYWNGRDREYHSDWTNEIQVNAENTVRVTNKLLEFVLSDTGVNFNEVSSGWRPLEVNDDTSNSSKTSKHITAQAVDIRDNEERLLARWCLANKNILTQLGIWMENPQWTRSWCHFQTVPPGSGTRIYRPSMAEPSTPPLVKWKRGNDIRMEQL